ncbi:Uncharacterized conserved protein [Halogranum gelatinilyticum]|uniref:Uncharacterized conserved protein n=1 Tax=Halogranum gelatinilyticum TaxID=660521 RepID=A0A1G9ZZC1_9EURY|nr:COG1361 S-layer family protein [Halogranum gelatinilyticum]SDN26251.1 Uncharacterized conserved protein [Halogranum gelatinilyticum]
MKKSQLLTLLVIGLVLVPTTALAVVEGEPNLNATMGDNEVVPGEDTQVTVTLQNTGEIDQSSNSQLNQRVTTARGVTVELREENNRFGERDPPIEVNTGKLSLGQIPDGSAVPATFSISVDEDAPTGTYKIPVRVTYTYTESIDTASGDYDEEDVRETFRVNLRVVDNARFEIVNTTSDLAVGDSGPVSVNIENTGTAAAEDASVQVASQNNDFTFSRASTSSNYVGEWEPGEVRTLTYDAEVAAGATPRNYALTATVNYDDTDGVASSSEAMAFGVTPRDEQTFALENTQSTLRVGQEGQLTGEVVNNGETAARNAVVVFETENPNVNPIETEYAIGTLEAGERTDFSFDTEISETAEAGPRQFTLAVTYRNSDGESRESDPLDVQANVAGAQEEFDVEGVNTTFAAGESGRMTMTVTNNRAETLTDISAKLFVDAPISASDDEAFIESLEPGESATIAFSTSVGGGALTDKTYPVSLDFRYDTADGDTLISETYQVPVTVTEPEDDGGLPLPLIGGVVLLVLLGVGGYLYTRRSA